MSEPFAATAQEHACYANLWFLWFMWFLWPPVVCIFAEISS